MVYVAICAVTITAVMTDVNDDIVEELGTLSNAAGTHKCLYANICGLSQGAPELAAIVDRESPHFIFLTECHIGKKDSINMWIPN